MERSIRDCSVCVIGGAGFLGSHLVDHLIEDRGCGVLVLDNLISGHRKHVHRMAQFAMFDIAAYSGEVIGELADALRTARIEYLFNYAAEPYIPECFERPMHFFQCNAVAALNVLEASRLAGVKGILQVSSAEIYGDCKGKIKESAPIEPHSTYGVSKVAADGLVQVRFRESGTPAIAMRQFNCVGERETHDYVIPEIIAQLHKGPHVYLGNNTTRDFQYAGDAVRMAAELLERGQFGEVYNMGSEECVTIYNLARMIGEQMHPGVKINIGVNPKKLRPWDIEYLQSDNSKLYSVIESRPQVSLKDALARTIKYFHANDNRWDTAVKV